MGAGHRRDWCGSTNGDAPMEPRRLLQQCLPPDCSESWIKRERTNEGSNFRLFLGVEVTTGSSTRLLAGVEVTTCTLTRVLVSVEPSTIALTRVSSTVGALTSISSLFDGIPKVSLAASASNGTLAMSIGVVPAIGTLTRISLPVGDSIFSWFVQSSGDPKVSLVTRDSYRTF